MFPVMFLGIILEALLFLVMLSHCRQSRDLFIFLYYENNKDELKNCIVSE